MRHIIEDEKGGTPGPPREPAPIRLWPPARSLAPSAWNAELAPLEPGPCAGATQGLSVLALVLGSCSRGSNQRSTAAKSRDIGLSIAFWAVDLWFKHENENEREKRTGP